MLVKNTETIQEYITVSNGFDFDRAKPWLKKAERKYIKPLIGKQEYLYFIDNDSDTSESKTLVRALLEEATVNLAFHLGFAQLFNHISSYGVSQANTENTKQSDWSEKRDIHRSFIRDGYAALDEVLKEMEYYLDDFPYWRASKSFTVLNENFTRHTDDFQKWFNIHNSRQTFLALKPTIREVFEQYFKPWLNEKTIYKIKKTSTRPIISRALELSQKAEVALTIAKIAETGMFEITETGLFLRWETLPHEKAYKDLDLKRLSKLSDLKQKAGEEYLKILRNHIEENLEVFTNYQVSKKNPVNKLIKKKSGLAI
ncbi:conserved hypothetical protein [Tenacibaculum sp. 190524A02b]|uniref:Uncharacterized protein n=1 Tax=Tenacibaculum vairaonense TaxID=3137860 RepID=A0ABP1F9K8_9FLAO